MSTATQLGARIGSVVPDGWVNWKASRETSKFGLHARGTGTGQATGQALDYFTNSAARTGWGTPSLTETTEYELVRLSYDYWLMVTLYRNHWLARRIVDVPARDMVRAWPRLTSDIPPDDLSLIDKAIRKTQTKSKLLLTLEWARLFGGAGALIEIDGQENMMDEPLDLDSIEIGAYKGLIPFDRWSGIYPKGPLGNDIKKPLEFNLPQHYEVMSSMTGESFQVHASRILRFTGPSVPQPEYQAQNYWGISCLEPVYEEIRKRDNMSWNILSLTYRANLIGLTIPDLAQMQSGAGMNQTALVQFHGRMQGLNQMMSNQSLVMLPKDGKMDAVQYSFGGLSDCYQMSQMDVAGAAEIPVTRLYGRTLTGLGQSNDADERIYEEKIALDQDDQLRPQLEVLYPVICMSVLGEIPTDLDLKFPSIRVLDHKEKAELATSLGNNVVALFNAGIIDRPMALKEIKQSSDITEIGTNITDEDIEAAEKEAAQGMPFGELNEPAPMEEGAGPKPVAGRASDDIGKPKAKHSIFAEIPIGIEYAKGVRRRIKNEAGDIVYDRVMQFPYGYIRDTIGMDGDEIDCIIGPNELSDRVFVVFMQDRGPDIEKRDNEHKICIGFDTPKDAEKAFFTMYPPEFLGSMTELSLDNFRDNWLGEVGAEALAE